LPPEQDCEQQQQGMVSAHTSFYKALPQVGQGACCLWFVPAV
jgi:hypothetical protein